uniref:HTH psq-type domain-containing protein n=1 Tax=Amphimedon queenslandica TaxID=400682 RepID=A0A1X7VXN3_AMPQE
MVRHYERKGNKMKWSEEDMEKAIDHAKRYKNIKGAATMYGIPVSTLRDHLAHGNVVKRPAHPTTLTVDEEKEIVETCLLFAEWGFGLC